VVTVSLKGPYPGVEGCQVIIYVPVLSNLIRVRGVKCTCKIGNLDSFSVEKLEEDEQ
jgi:hypothetical protein